MKLNIRNWTLKISVLVVLLILTGTIGIYWYNLPHPLTYKVVAFKNLPGWNKADMQKSLQTFRVSCNSFLRMDPKQPVGSQKISMSAKDWQPVCKAAFAENLNSPQNAKAFFETWFTPVQWYNNKPVRGLFTGYYQPYFRASLNKTDEFSVPIYGVPSNLITVDLEDFDKSLPPRHLVGHIVNNKLVPYPSRAKINKGLIENKAPVLVWVKSHIDRLFLEIQGSGILELPDGKLMNIGYAGENGRRYTPIGRVLVELGVMNKENLSMQAIRDYLESHPDSIIPVINKNKSFVFFRIFDKSAAIGALGVNLTPGYSLAVDRKWIPLGMPLWLDTTRPSPKSQTPVVLQRLMIAQDTGGAIRGIVRGDVFWGGGDKATFIAGKMKNQGIYWLLIPNHMMGLLPKNFDEGV